MLPETERLPVEQAALFTGLSVSTLNKLRVFGGGPEYLKLGRRVLYERHSLQDWMAARRCHSTSQYK